MHSRTGNLGSAHLCAFTVRLPEKKKYLRDEYISERSYQYYGTRSEESAYGDTGQRRELTG